MARVLHGWEAEIPKSYPDVLPCKDYLSDSFSCDDVTSGPQSALSMDTLAVADSLEIVL